MVDVLGLGDAGVDFIMRVDKLPGHDEKILATKVERHAGGVIANFLCALSKLGTPSGFIGCLGDDELGVFVRAHLAAAGIDLSRLVVKKGEETYFCVSLLDKTGEKALVIGVTSTIFPGPHDIADSMVTEAKLLHTTGLRIEAALHAISLAKIRGMMVSLDLEPSTLSQGVAAVKPLIEKTDLLFVNRNAVEIVFPDEEDSAIAGRKLLAWGPKWVILTRGNEGSIVVTSDLVLRTPAFSVPVRDTTGAGDCFNASFVHGLLKGWSLEQTAVFANAAAAISITAVGAQSALPTECEVESFIRTGRLPIAAGEVSGATGA